MAEPSKESDQSMEDILQSIKRIIADEGDVAPASGGSDVLELTELLAEDAAPPAAPEPAPMPAPTPAPTPAPKSAQDDIDALFNAPAAPEPMPAPEPAPAPTPPPATTAAVMAPAAKAAAPESLMSEATVAASVAALSTLSHQPEAISAHISPALRSGITVEDLVVEALRPMLKEWLDGNLPALVRSLVEREIRRLHPQ